MTLYRISVGQDDGELPDHIYMLSAPSKKHAAVAAFIIDGGTRLDCDQPFNELVDLALRHCSVIEADAKERT